MGGLWISLAHGVPGLFGSALVAPGFSVSGGVCCADDLKGLRRIERSY
jgi:hypothetical protein